MFVFLPPQGTNEVDITKDQKSKLPRDCKTHLELSMPLAVKELFYSSYRLQLFEWTLNLLANIF